MEIEGFRGLYMIYPDGGIWSNYGKGKFLKHVVNQGGYHQVSLCRDRKQKIFYIHRLVAIHYIPNPDNKPFVDHINQNTHDYRLENLRWVTHSENMQNKGKNITNTSGHKYISYHKQRNVWKFQKRINKKLYQKCFDTKIEALCYKLCFILRHKQLQELRQIGSPCVRPESKHEASPTHS